MLSRLILALCVALFGVTAAAASPLAPAVTVAYTAPKFDSDTAAQRHCPRDTVVWLNIPTGVYHYAGERWYGRTRNGAYVCEREAIAEGDRATRNGQ